MKVQKHPFLYGNIMYTMGIAMQWTQSKVKLESVKKTVFRFQNGKCAYCGKKLSKLERTLDHVVPLSKGGAKHSIENIVMSCRLCNQKKGSCSPEYYYDQLRRFTWLKLPKKSSKKKYLYPCP